MRSLAVIVFGVLPCARPVGAQIIIPAGAHVDLGTGHFDAGCLDVGLGGTLLLSHGSAAGVRSVSVSSGGTFDGGAGSFAWSGDWSNGGHFIAGSSTATSVDGCGSTTSVFRTGDHFASLSLQSVQGREIRFSGGQFTGVSNSLTARGTSALLLRIRSTAAGNPASFIVDPAATQDIFAVDVADNRAVQTPIAPGLAVSFASIKGPDSDGWFSLSAADIPAISTAGLVLMAALMACVAMRMIGRT